MKQAKGHLFVLRIVWIGMYEVWHFVTSTSKRLFVFLSFCNFNFKTSFCLFVFLSFCNFNFKTSFCLFVFLSFCLFVWGENTNLMSFQLRCGVPCILFGRDHSDRRNIVSMEEMGESLVRGAFRLQRERERERETAASG